MSELCPVCGTTMTIDYVYTGEDEVKVSICPKCGWPPSHPASVEEWKKVYQRKIEDGKD